MYTPDELRNPTQAHLLAKSQSRKYPATGNGYKFAHSADLDGPARALWLLFHDPAYVSKSCLPEATALKVAVRDDCQVPTDDLATKRHHWPHFALEQHDQKIFRTIISMLARLAIVLEPNLPASSLKGSRK